MPSSSATANIMLTTGAAEALQSKVRSVVALLHGDLLDRVRHIGHSDAQKTLRDVARIAPLPCCLGDLLSHICETFAHGICIERQIAIQSKYRREVSRLDLADAHIGVCDGQRAASFDLLPVDGIRASPIEAYAKARSVEMQHGPAARVLC